MACTQQAATMSNSLAHPLRVLGRWQTTQHKHEYNTHCNSGSCGLANPAQTIEIPDNPSPLNLFAIPSHTALNCFHPAMVPQVEAMFGIAIPSLINYLVYTSV